MQSGLVVDFNDDGSLDLILAGISAGVVELHANNGIGRLGPGDRTAPELTLLGETDITVPSGAVYVDAGATAIDDIDGDLTNAITTSGGVNTAVVGTYTINYTVSDRASNSSQVSRKVFVGVNQGSGGGGGGGGMLSMLTLIMLGMIASLTSPLRVARTLSIRPVASRDKMETEDRPDPGAQNARRRARPSRHRRVR
jgi:hypothetical protein